MNLNLKWSVRLAPCAISLSIFNLKEAMNLIGANFTD